jgi:hypothetical protein
MTATPKEPAPEPVIAIARQAGDTEERIPPQMVMRSPLELRIMADGMLIAVRQCRYCASEAPNRCSICGGAGVVAFRVAQGQPAAVAESVLTTSASEPVAAEDEEE